MKITRRYLDEYTEQNYQIIVLQLHDINYYETSCKNLLQYFDLCKLKSGR
jgi:hypothetical protein